MVCYLLPFTYMKRIGTARDWVSGGVYRWYINLWPSGLSVWLIEETNWLRKKWAVLLFFYFLGLLWERVWGTEYRADIKVKIIESDKSQKCEENLILVRNEKRNIIIVGPWKLAFWGFVKGVFGIILCVFSFSMLVWYDMVVKLNTLPLLWF